MKYKDSSKKKLLINKGIKKLYFPTFFFWLRMIKYSTPNSSKKIRMKYSWETEGGPLET